jgi:curved DNA-binding protein
MIFKDYYKILGLESNKVTLEEIKLAYREKAKKYHPDINVGNAGTEEIFKDINEAYKTLSNDKLRRKYDFNWNRYIGRRKTAESTSQNKRKKTFKEILFDIFFGGVFTPAKKKEKLVPEYGENIVTEIEVSIKDAFFGISKKLKFRDVNGRETSFNIKIPAGVQNGDKLRIVGQGKPGKNGGRNGDLLVVVHIKDDKLLKLVGNDLYYQMSLETWEAALGTQRIINILNEDIKVIVPKSTNSGDTLLIKEKGYRDAKGGRGNLYVVTKIVIQKRLSKEQVEIYQKLKELNEKK